MARASAPLTRCRALRSRSNRARARASVARREQRVKAELDAAKIWEENWGPLFAPDEPHNYEDRIKKLEEEAAKCVSRGSGGRGGRRRVCEGSRGGKRGFSGRARYCCCARVSLFLPTSHAPSLSLPRSARARPQDQGRPLVTAVGRVRRLGPGVPRVRTSALEGHEDEDGHRGQNGRGRRQLHGARQVRAA